MISPERYYVDFLEGKTQDEILTVIRGLKQAIGRLKNSMENPYKDNETISHPSEDARLQMTREYLEKAKDAYAKAGGVYNFSKSEEKAANFLVNLENLQKIIFIIGGYFGGYRRYTVELTEEMKAYTKLCEDEQPLVLLNKKEEPFTKSTFLEALRELHIGEWRRYYTTDRFGYEVLDGTQWELEFEYSNGHKSVRFEGDNSYPYNFQSLERLFGIRD